MRITRARHGLTLLEVVVALALLGTGVLATLSVQAGVIALQTRGALARALAARLDTTLDSLRASPCATLAAGGTIGREGRIDWRVTRAPSSITLDATATPAPPARPGGAFHARTVVPCA